MTVRFWWKVPQDRCKQHGFKTSVLASASTSLSRAGAGTGNRKIKARRHSVTSSFSPRNLTNSCAWENPTLQLPSSAGINQLSFADVNIAVPSEDLTVSLMLMEIATGATLESWNPNAVQVTAVLPMAQGLWDVRCSSGNTSRRVGGTACVTHPCPYHELWILLSTYGAAK